MLREAAAAVADRGRPSTTCCRSTTAPASGSNPDMAGRPTLIHGNSQLFFAGHGPAVGEQRRQHQEQVVLGHRRGRRARRRRRGRDHRPGRPVRRLGRLRQGRHGASSSTTCSASSEFATDGRRRRSRPGTHQVRMEFAYDGGGLGQGRRRHALLRRRRRSAPAGSAPPSRWSSPPTRPPTSATSPAPRSPPTTRAETSRFTGKIDWVQIDLGDDDHDHFIDPDERLRIAMARQ